MISTVILVNELLQPSKFPENAQRLPKCAIKLADYCQKGIFFLLSEAKNLRFILISANSTRST